MNNRTPRRSDELDCREILQRAQMHGIGFFPRCLIPQARGGTGIMGAAAKAELQLDTQISACVGDCRERRGVSKFHLIDTFRHAERPKGQCLNVIAPRTLKYKVDWHFQKRFNIFVRIIRQ